MTTFSNAQPASLKRVASGDGPGRSFSSLHDVHAMPPMHPAVAILLLTLAAPFSSALVGDDYFVPGALFWSALVLTIALLAIPVYVAFRTPLAIVRAEHLLMIGLVYWLLLDLLQGSYGLEGASREGIRLALIAIAVFASGVWTSALLPAWRLPIVVRRTARTNLSTNVVWSAIVVCFILGFTRFALPSGFNPVVMLQALKGNRWSAPWARGELGGWDAILDHFAYFGYIVPALTVMLAERSRRLLSPRVIMSAIFSIILLVLLAQSGSRRIVGVVCGAAMLTWILSQWGRARVRTVVVATAGAVVLIVAMQWLLEHRTGGYAQDDRKVIDDAAVHVDDNILRASQMIDLIPSAHDFVRGQYVVWVLARPIPRIMWPGKPLDPGIDFPSLVSVRGVSLSSSIVGEAYMSFGWIGLFVFGFIYGRIAGSYTRLLSEGNSSTRILLYSFGVLSLFSGLRSAIELVLMSYTVLALIAVLALLRVLRILPHTSRT